MKFEVAAGCMKLLSNIGRQGFLDGLGVSRAEFDKLVGDEPWMSVDRNRMTVLLHTLVNASVDAMGLPRFNLPAEYLAAGIALFVSPVNVHPACLFAPPSRSADDMGRIANVDNVSPEQLFALVVQLYASPGKTAARAQFEKHTGIAIDRMAPPVTPRKEVR